jgi:hypothetical protein
VRELKRGGQRTLVAIQFWMDDEEPVWVGHYNRPHVHTTASAAVKLIMDAPDPEGYEVIVSRSIAPSELRKVRAVPQGIGWRYMPKAHLRRPCPCPWCMRGDTKAQRRRAYDEKRDRALNLAASVS